MKIDQIFLLSYDAIKSTEIVATRRFAKRDTYSALKDIVETNKITVLYQKKLPKAKTPCYRSVQTRLVDEFSGKIFTRVVRCKYTVLVR